MSIKKAIILGDVHIPYQNNKALNIIYQILKEHKFDEIILGGDIIDGTQLSKFPNYEEYELELWQEINLFKNFINNLKEVSPKSKIIYLEDNHFSERLKRYMIEHPELKNLIKIDLPVDKVIEYNKPYFPFGQRQLGFIHGYNSNKYFAEKYTREFNHNLVVCHTHTFQHYVAENGIECYGIGCLCKTMKYLRNKPHRWRNGFGVFIYDTKIRKYWFETYEIKDGYCYFNNKLYKFTVGD